MKIVYVLLAMSFLAACSQATPPPTSPPPIATPCVDSTGKVIHGTSTCP